MSRGDPYYQFYKNAPKDWCSDHGWKYLNGTDITGEDQCIVLMDVSVGTEEISRGRNLLVIVTTRGNLRWVNIFLLSFNFQCRANDEKLDIVSQHESPTFNCSSGSKYDFGYKLDGDCPYIGRQLLQKVFASKNYS